jgi:2TM domain
MNDTVVNDELLERAKKRVQDTRDLYLHLGVYVIVNAALFAINMITNPDTLWFFWPLLGWGVGVALHVFSFFTEGRLLGPEWEERKVREIVEQEESRGRRDDAHVA